MEGREIDWCVEIDSGGSGSAEASNLVTCKATGTSILVNQSYVISCWCIHTVAVRRCE